MCVDIYIYIYIYIFAHRHIHIVCQFYTETIHIDLVRFFPSFSSEIPRQVPIVPCKWPSSCTPLTNGIRRGQPAWQRPDQWPEICSDTDTVGKLTTMNHEYEPSIHKYLVIFSCIFVFFIFLGAWDIFLYFFVWLSYLRISFASTMADLEYPLQP